MRLIKSLAISIGLLTVLGACAIGNQVDYRASKPTLEASTEKDVVVAVVDQRNYVVDGTKSPDFVGLKRGGWGNPFDVTTTTGNSFASDVSATIVDALKNSQVAARSIVVPPSGDAQPAMDAATEAAADRAIVLQINEWKTDIYASMEVDYNLVANVLGPDGSVLVKKQTSGNDPLPDGDGSFESGYSRTASSALNRKIQFLLNDPEVLAALQ